MKQELKRALDYVREQMDEDDLAILHAEINKCYNQHLVPTFTLVDADQVIELLGEYGEETTCRKTGGKTTTMTIFC